MYTLISEISSDFLIQGFGLHQHQDESEIFVGKVGGQEIQLVPSVENLDFDDKDEKDVRVLSVGFANASQHYRPGDVLMTGSDDLLDRAFLAMDEIEQRCVVVSLTDSQDPKHLYFSKEQMSPFVEEWKGRKISFLCLWMVDPIESEGRAKLVTILRKIVSKD